MPVRLRRDVLAPPPHGNPRETGSMGLTFSYRLRVRYSDCDVQGVVYNAHYLTYLDVAMTELWRALLG